MVVKHLANNNRSYAPKYEAVEKRNSTPDLSKGRTASPFPEHMTRNASRMGLNMLSEKMLKMNMYLKT